MSDWHPLLAAQEREPGTWTMVDLDGREYGTVQIVRRDSAIAYRVTAMGRQLPYSTNLRDACMLIHRTFIAAHAPGKPPGGYYPDLNGIVKIDDTRSH